MTQTLLLSNSPEVAERVGYAANGRLMTVAPGPLPANVGQILGLLSEPRVPDIVFLHVEGDPQVALPLIGELDKSFGASVVLVTDHGDQVGLAAVHAGACDVISPIADVPLIRQAYERAVYQAEGRQALKAARRPTSAQESRPSGRVITIASPKGGVGKTTVSSNVALGIAMREPGSVVLVDLDIHFGDIAHAFALIPEYTIVDTVKAAVAQDILAVKSLLTVHKSGLFVVAGSDSPVAADTITAPEVARLLKMLAAEFKYVVVDTAPGLSEHTLAVLDQTTELIFVTSMDVPGVRGLRKELDTLRELGMLMEPRHVVLNFTHESRGMSVRDVEATIREEVDFVMPQDNIVPQSTNRGTPLIGSGGRDMVTRQLQRLIDTVVPQPATEPEAPARVGLFGRRKALGGVR